MPNVSWTICVSGEMGAARWTMGEAVAVEVGTRMSEGG